MKSGTIHAPMRRLSSAQRAASGLCPKVKSKIKVSGATKVADDLAAAATAQKTGDSAGATAAGAAATSDFEQWASSSGASTVGDWIAIAQAAQALGDESLSSSALDNARSAADANVKKATPADPCKASPGELDCFVQANAIAQMLGGDGTPDLAKKLDCGEVWSFTMVMSGESSGGAFGTFTWKAGRFNVNRSTGAITDASPGGPGWLGDAAGTYNCHGTGLPSESGSVPPFHFHYRLTERKVTPTLFTIRAPSSDFHMKNPFHGTICRGFGELGVQLHRCVREGRNPHSVQGRLWTDEGGHLADERRNELPRDDRQGLRERLTPAGEGVPLAISRHGPWFSRSPTRWTSGCGRPGGRRA